VWSKEEDNKKSRLSVLSAERKSINAESTHYRKRQERRGDQEE